ncbi:hypothetical protein P618_200014 [Holospora obtusa F1]|uniref:UPF0235 protein P618_200014 n=1 Tax=Holospora obtusa F1 TaxID=1399147 RepID=W6TFI9_HOLOB|nr:DUF167 domain-containing protein [Holospora obtusa]ETZ07774.1 hypothetical protein P618_200014 [Holospora obtusa F1]
MKDDLTILHVKVITKSKFERVKKEFMFDGSILYKIYVNAAPEQGRANKAVISLLSKELGISKSFFKIISGEKYREKYVKILCPLDLNRS